MNQRSLVGMTQSARKRAARFDAWHKAVTYWREVSTRALRRCIAADRTILRVGNVAAEYARQRLRYRISQRLRPCLGCPACDEPRSSVRQLRGWVRLAGLRLFAWKRIATEPCNGFTGRWSAGWTVHLRTGERIGGAWRDDDLRAVWETAAQHCLNGMRKALGSAPRCDGSGVLPAKRRAEMSRKQDMELPPVDPPGCYLCGGEGWLPAFTCTAEGVRTLAEQPCPECSQAKRIAGGGR